MYWSLENAILSAYVDQLLNRKMAAEVIVGRCHFCLIAGGDNRMSSILNDFSAEALTSAIKGNLFEYFEYLGSSPKAEMHEDPLIKWVFTGIPHSFLNNVLYTHLTSDNVDEVIRQTLANIRSENITKLSWWAEPGTKPVNLGEYLIKHGFAFDDGEPGMALDLLDLRGSVDALGSYH